LHWVESIFQVVKSALTDKYYIAVLSLIGLVAYVGMYKLIKGSLEGLEQTTAFAFGTSLGGVFTGLGVLCLGLDRSACKEVNDVRAAILLGGAHKV
jgi:nucleoside permease NupC